MDASQAIREYFAKLAELIATFDFTRPGKDKAMGLDAAHLVAEGIFDRSIQLHSGPDGIWLANSPRYARWKQEKYNVDPILVGVRTGQMLSMTSLLGKVDLQPDTVEIHYGTGLPPTSSMASKYINASDTSITDIEKAFLFTRQKGPFFALDDRIADAVKGYFADELLRFINELNAK